ncbi:hypothetical protein PFISCL1PPCAC_21365, partial [Pristionchus fissidentatus]
VLADCGRQRALHAANGVGDERKPTNLLQEFNDLGLGCVLGNVVDDNSASDSLQRIVLFRRVRTPDDWWSLRHASAALQQTRQLQLLHGHQGEVAGGGCGRCRSMVGGYGRGSGLSGRTLFATRMFLLLSHRLLQYDGKGARK